MTSSNRRWPAYAAAVLFLGYALGKAVFAMQDRLGFPGGPPVTDAQNEAYFLAPGIAQWFAAASGVAGAVVAVSTVTPLGRVLPRPLMLSVLAGMLLAVAGGAGIMIVDGFFDVGIGWRWYHGLVGVLVLGLFLELTRSFVVTTRRVAAT